MSISGKTVLLYDNSCFVIFFMKYKLHIDTREKYVEYCTNIGGRMRKWAGALDARVHKQIIASPNGNILSICAEMGVSTLPY